MILQPPPDPTMALRGLLSKSLLIRTVFKPVVSLRAAEGRVCGLVSCGSAVQPHVSRYDWAANASNAVQLGRRDDAWRSYQQQPASRSSKRPRRERDQQQGSQRAAQRHRLAAADGSTVMSADAAELASAGRDVAGEPSAAITMLGSEPEIETLHQRSSVEEAVLDGSGPSDAATSSRSHALGKKAGAFLRLPMVQLGKEQLSSAQRAARRTPYSRKLKNEAQRERNRCGPCAGGPYARRTGVTATCLPRAPAAESTVQSLRRRFCSCPPADPRRSMASV